VIEIKTKQLTKTLTFIGLWY